VAPLRSGGLAALVPADWKQFTGFGIEFSYPPTTPQGQTAEIDEERVSDHRCEVERVHVHSADRQELYIEFARFRELTTKHEYARHKPYLEQRFGAGSVTELTQTSLLDRQAWTYSFEWNEGGRPMERTAILLQLDRGTCRIIRDPRSALNDHVLATLTLVEY
jgi:hypothetical protein